MKTLGWTLFLLPFLHTLTPGYTSRARADSFSPPFQDFISACTSAFAQSSGQQGETPTAEHLAFGKSLCECTATESKSQKVSVARLKKETAKIKADPKYKIQDKGVLAALQYCSMKATEGLDPDQK